VGSRITPNQRYTVNYGAMAEGSGTYGIVNVLNGGALALAVTANSSPMSLTVSSGSIDGAGQLVVPATLADTTISTPKVTDTLTLSGNLSGAGPITKTGNGLLILSGNNSYSDGTIVEAGTLKVTAADSLPDGSSLTVGAGGSSLFGAALGATQPANLSLIASTGTIVAVPEPGTLALLIAGLVASIGATFRRSKSQRQA